MLTIRYVYWQDEGMWLGYIEEFPDHKTPAEFAQAARPHGGCVFIDSANVQQPDSH